MTLTPDLHLVVSEAREAEAEKAAEMAPAALQMAFSDLTQGPAPLPDGP